MIGPAPEFTNSEYFESNPRWRMKPEAPKELKKEFEDYMNSSTSLKKRYPNLKDPYICWDGKYRRSNGGMCWGCDHPAYAPSKNVNPKRACKKCQKQATRSKRPIAKEI